MEDRDKMHPDDTACKTMPGPAYQSVPALRTMTIPVRWLGELDVLNHQVGETAYLDFMVDALREALSLDLSLIFASDIHHTAYGKLAPQTIENLDPRLKGRESAKAEAKEAGPPGGKTGAKVEAAPPKLPAKPKPVQGKPPGGLAFVQLAEDADNAPKQLPPPPKQVRLITAIDLFDHFGTTRLAVPFRISAVELITLICENLMSLADTPKHAFKLFHSSGVEVIYEPNDVGRPMIFESTDILDPLDDDFDQFMGEEEQKRVLARASGGLKVEETIEPGGKAKPAAPSGPAGPDGKLFQNPLAPVPSGKEQAVKKMQTKLQQTRISSDSGGENAEDVALAGQLKAKSDALAGKDTAKAEAAAAAKPKSKPTIADPLGGGASGADAKLQQKTAAVQPIAGAADRDGGSGAEADAKAKDASGKKKKQAMSDIRGLRRIVWVGNQHMRGSRHFRRKPSPACRVWLARVAPADTDFVRLVCAFFEVPVVVWDRDRGLYPDIIQALLPKYPEHEAKLKVLHQAPLFSTVMSKNPQMPTAKIILSKAMLEAWCGMPLAIRGENKYGPLRTLLDSGDPFIDAFAGAFECTDKNLPSDGVYSAMERIYRGYLGAPEDPLPFQGLFVEPTSPDAMWTSRVLQKPLITEVENMASILLRFFRPSSKGGLAMEAVSAPGLPTPTSEEQMTESTLDAQANEERDAKARWVEWMMVALAQVDASQVHMDSVVEHQADSPDAEEGGLTPLGSWKSWVCPELDESVQEFDFETSVMVLNDWVQCEGWRLQIPDDGLPQPKSSAFSSLLEVGRGWVFGSEENKNSQGGSGVAGSGSSWVGGLQGAADVSSGGADMIKGGPRAYREYGTIPYDGVLVADFIPERPRRRGAADFIPEPAEGSESQI